MCPGLDRNSLHLKNFYFEISLHFFIIESINLQERVHPLSCPPCVSVQAEGCGLPERLHEHQTQSGPQEKRPSEPHTQIRLISTHPGELHLRSSGLCELALCAEVALAVHDTIKGFWMAHFLLQWLIVSVTRLLLGTPLFVVETAGGA